MHMSRYPLFIIIACTVLLVSGCCSFCSGTNMATVTPTPAAGASPVSTMGDIDTLLQKGPVFVEFGATWCTWCTQEQPIIDSLKKNYTGITFVHVDTDENSVLPDAFSVDGIPQMDIIVNKTADGSYTYIDPYGKTTNDRTSSRIIGYTDQDTLKSLLDAAAAARGK